VGEEVVVIQQGVEKKINAKDGRLVEERKCGRSPQLGGRKGREMR
jgi:hypothetical protein